MITNEQRSQYAGYTALVTGGSRGIGRTIAVTLAEKGYNVAICYQTSDQAAEELLEQIHREGTNCIKIKADLSDPRAIESLFDQIDDTFDHLDLLVNNAGITRDGLLATMSIDDMTNVLNVNLLATMLCCREAIKRMLPRKIGNIINISSISANKPNKGQCNYEASKGAVEAFTRALAVEVARKNIRVNCIAPGIIATDMVANLLDKHKDSLREIVLSKRFGIPEDVAKAVIYLSDPNNQFVTGEILHVNGGMRLV